MAYTLRNLFPDEPNFCHHPLDVDFEPHFLLHKKNSIHQNLDGALNNEYHVNYAPLFAQVQRFPWRKRHLLALHEMAGIKASPYLSYKSASSHQARDIILNEFVTYTLKGKEPPDSKKNLAASLGEVLREAGFAQEEIQETLTAFDSDLSIEQYHAAFLHQNVVKARGELLRYRRRVSRPRGYEWLC